MVPYAAYLRVYEPVESLTTDDGSGKGTDVTGGVPGSDEPAEPGSPHELTTAEQQRSRRAAVGTGTIALVAADSGASFVIHRDGRTFVAPADELVRCWIALARLAGSLSPSAALALTPGAVLDDAGEALQAWQQTHPDGAPHVREATWRLPLAWLLLADPDERESYRVGEQTTARYLTPMVQARRRVARAHAVSRRHFPDSDEVAELVDLGRWLEAFHAHSWVELDLAGLGMAVAGVDPDEPDRSLRDVHAAVQALRDGKLEEAADRYHDITVWWGSLALREHAN